MGANDVIALTVITIHVNDRCPYDHVTELFVAFSTCDTDFLPYLLLKAANRLHALMMGMACTLVLFILAAV